MGQPVSRQYQDLSTFTVPQGFRGRPGATVLLWQLVQATLFGLSPRPLYGWRRMLLRLFGAKIGDRVLIRPTARIAFPWKLTIGDHSWIGDDVELYNLNSIVIGANAVVSQRSYLCTASHAPDIATFDYVTGAVVVADQAWIAADVFIGPGVKIGFGAVIGARSLVDRDIPEGVMAFGSPATIRKQRHSAGADLREPIEKLPK